MQNVRRLRKNQLERDSEEYEEDKEEEDSRKVTYESKQFDVQGEIQKTEYKFHPRETYELRHEDPCD